MDLLWFMILPLHVQYTELARSYQYSMPCMGTSLICPLQKLSSKTYLLTLSFVSSGWLDLHAVSRQEVEDAFGKDVFLCNKGAGLLVLMSSTIASK